MRDENDGDPFHLIHTPSGVDLCRHRSDGTVVRGRCAPAPDGQPLPPGAELVELYSTPEGPRVRTLHSGPAKVNSPAYRENWTSIFGTAQAAGQA